ncbi:hypothetical protein F4860DRAFT_484258, partial [Xylaria cubensis]
MMEFAWSAEEMVLEFDGYEDEDAEMWEDGWYIGDMADGDAPINQQDNQDDEDVKPDIIDLTNEDEDAERIIIDLTHDDEDGTPVKKETIAVKTEQGAVKRGRFGESDKFFDFRRLPLVRGNHITYSLMTGLTWNVIIWISLPLFVQDLFMSRMSLLLEAVSLPWKSALVLVCWHDDRNLGNNADLFLLVC